MTAAINPGALQAQLVGGVPFEHDPMPFPMEIVLLHFFGAVRIPGDAQAVFLAPIVTDARAASSLHPGGVNALMADGAARRIADGIDCWPIDALTGEPLGARRAEGGWWTGLPRPGVWQALATRAGGEPSG